MQNPDMPGKQKSTKGASMLLRDLRIIQTMLVVLAAVFLGKLFWDIYVAM